MTVYDVDFAPIGRRGECRPGDSLLACARKLGVDIVSLCAGKGACYACKVKVLDGTVSEATTIERALFSPQELESGWRLACQTYPTSNVRVSVPTESMTTPQRTQVEGLEIVVPPEPVVTAYRVKLPAPSLSDLRGDDERLLATLNQQYQLPCRSFLLDVRRVV
jgi:ferredoxin